MDVLHLNVCKDSDPLTGIKRYEDELYNNMIKFCGNISLRRIKRREKRFGGTFISWATTYNFCDADIVHATFQGTAPAIYFRRCPPLRAKSRFFVTVHDLIPVLYPSTIKDISTKIQWKIVPGALNKADYIIAISEFTKKELVRVLDIQKDKIYVVHQGVDRSTYHPLDRYESKKRFNLDLNEKHILVVASNLEHKRMDLVKRIHDEISDIRPDVKVLKVGYGDALDGEGIINLGWVPEEAMPILYNASDAYLHTSEYEGFGLPILEAMACGIPVVVSQKASIPEIVGDCGSMVDLGCDDCVGQFVEELLEAIDKGIDEREIERSKRFSWENTAKKTANTYKMTAEDFY